MHEASPTGAATASASQRRRTVCPLSCRDPLKAGVDEASPTDGATAIGVAIQVNRADVLQEVRAALGWARACLSVRSAGALPASPACPCLPCLLCCCPPLPACISLLCPSTPQCPPASDTIFLFYFSSTQAGFEALCSLADEHGRQGLDAAVLRSGPGPRRHGAAAAGARQAGQA